jgi:hypothetical protein
MIGIEHANLLSESIAERDKSLLAFLIAYHHFRIISVLVLTIFF